MIGKTNVGGSVRAYAHIVVSHDSDATVSCTYSKRIVELSDDMTLILVSDNASSCVITATTTGGVTNTKTVSVTSGGSYYVLLYNRYDFVISGAIQGNAMTRTGKRPTSSDQTQTVNPGVDYETGYIQITDGGTGTQNTAGIVYFPETVDLSKYTIVHAKGTAYNSTGVLDQCGVNVWTSVGDYQNENRRAKTNLLAAGTSSYTTFDVTADISTFTDASALIGFNVRRNGSGSSAIRVTDVWVD